MNGIDDWYLNYAHRHELTPGFSHNDDIPDPYVPGEIPSQGREVVTGKGSRSRSGRRPEPVNVPRSIPPADRGGSWESAAEKWWKVFPEGTNRECLRALQEAGHRGLTTQLIHHLRSGTPVPEPAPRRKKSKKAAGRKAASRKAASRTAAVPAKTEPVAARRPRRRSRAQQPQPAIRPSWREFAVRWLRAHPAASNRQWLDCLAENGFHGVTIDALAALRTKIRTIDLGSARRMPSRPHQPAATTGNAGFRYCPGCDLAVGPDGQCRC